MTQSRKAPCRHCGTKSIAKGRTGFCSDECASAAVVLRKAARSRTLYDAVCKSCQKPRDRHGRGVVLCSACKAKSEETYLDRLRERYRRRKEAEMAAAGRPLVMRQDIYKDGSKYCPRCFEYVDVVNFPTRKENGKASSYCRPCQRSYNQERRLRLEYGITWDEYELMLACQDYRCAICRGKPRKWTLAVDHDHKTGEIRGLLCSRCNHKLLGAANDDPTRLRAAADYLERFEPREVFGERRIVPGFKPVVR